MQGTVDFIMEECCRCGILFYMTAALKKRLYANKGESFYCPVGHGQHYIGKTEEQKLRDQLQATKKETKWLNDRLRSEMETREHTERRLASVRGHLTRAKNRLVEGNCPCCDAHFADLETHIKAAHPDFELEPLAEQAEQPPKRKRGRPRKDTVVEPSHSERKAATSKVLAKN